MDFTLTKYRQLLEVFVDGGYRFVTFSDYISHSQLDEKVIVLRHDVDALPENSMETAKIENDLDIVATYYFRAVPECWDEMVITSIARMGHEVGYHYESLSTCGGDMVAAYSDFIGNLNRLRELVPVTSICMHGSPRSPYDSKDIWAKYEYKTLGIVGEPYLDTDFSAMFYLTDTGRRWDGFRVSVRDRIFEYQDIWQRNGLVFHTTNDLLLAIQTERLPLKVMITTHPQRWTDNIIKWGWEYIFQNIKNMTKRLFIICKNINNRKLNE